MPDDEAGAWLEQVLVAEDGAPLVAIDEHTTWERVDGADRLVPVYALMVWFWRDKRVDADLSQGVRPDHLEPQL